MLRFRDYLIESNTSDVVHCFDVDDCLVFSKSRIYYTLPGETKERSVGTGEFAEIRTKLPKDTKFDFRDFRQYGSIYMSLRYAKPHLKVLKYIDMAVKNKQKIGILTARGSQDAVRAALKDLLLYKDDKGNFSKLPRALFRKKFIFAVNDENTARSLSKMGGSGSVSNPEVLKAVVLQKIFGDKYSFRKIIFYDDDINNIKAVDALKDPRITTVKV